MLQNASLSKGGVATLPIVTMDAAETPNPSNSPPDPGRNMYCCPHLFCGAFAHQIHGDLWIRLEGDEGPSMVDGWLAHQCQACRQWILWRRARQVGAIEQEWHLVYPLAAIGPSPNLDMPPAVRELYVEAQEVAAISARSAAALLRLALQVLIDDLVTGSGSINDKIGDLVGRGLHPQTQQAMDILRVVGNNAVHPGQLSLNDDPELVPSLFMLVNIVVEQMISRPRHIQSLYDALPPGNRQAINRRDGTS